MLRQYLKRGVNKVNIGRSSSDISLLLNKQSLPMEAMMFRKRKLSSVVNSNVQPKSSSAKKGKFLSKGMTVGEFENGYWYADQLEDFVMKLVFQKLAN